MPIYEYKCQECNKKFEKLQRVSEPQCKECPTCGGKLKKLVSSPAIQFKGQGFYITDYAKKGGPSEEKGGGKAKGKKEDAAQEKAETIPSDKPCSD